MEFIKTTLDGLVIVKPKVFKDERGYFLESFRDNMIKKNGINFNFVQSNISKSIKGTIRGLHYQVGEMAQGKLCQVIYGKVLDIAVDIRFGSPTFGKYYAQILSEQNHLQVWIPPGFAHGFSVLSDEAIFYYKCTQYYSKENERAIRYDDPFLKIDWIVENPIVSEKDLSAKFFNQIDKDFIYNNYQNNL
jgi:dTDP-4-dehydrorhamnose 3,5-epimerase